MNAVEILQAYFQNKTYEFHGDIKSEIRKMNEQSLAGYLYYVYGKPFQNVYFALTLVQERFYHLQDEISDIFNANQIDYMFLKGSVLSKLYPDTALRTRGDIDVIVRKNDYERANNLLLENGYTLFDKCYHHNEYYKNKLMIELHQDLFEKNEIFYDYFTNIFHQCNCIEKHRYEMPNELSYIYGLAHLNKHLIFGEGLRYILDFYYMQKNWNIDYNKLENELEKLNLITLYKNINSAIFIITDDKINDNIGEYGEKLIQLMLENGIHSKNIESVSQTERQFALRRQSKFKYVLSSIFLKDMTLRKRLYPKLSKHKMFYPIIIIHRLFFLTIKKLPNLFKLVKLNKKEKEKIQNDQEKLGIIVNIKK